MSDDEIAKLKAELTEARVLILACAILLQIVTLGLIAAWVFK